MLPIASPYMTRADDEPMIATRGGLGFSCFRNTCVDDHLHSSSFYEINFCSFTQKCINIPGKETQVSLTDCYCIVEPPPSLPLPHQIKTASLASIILCSGLIHSGNEEYSAFECSLLGCTVQCLSCNWNNDECYCVRSYFCFRRQLCQL
jgi:hypothetical protein